MLKWLQGLLERLALRVYRTGARQLGAQSASWKGIEIISSFTVLPKVLAALDSVHNTAAMFSQLIETRLKTIICVNGVITKTLPVTRTFLIDSAHADAMETQSLAYVLVRSAAYIDFYTSRSIFLPNVFFKKRDRLAKSSAEQVAKTFQIQIGKGRE